MTEIYTKLDLVRSLLKKLGNAVAENYRDFIKDPDLNTHLIKFRQAYEEAEARLNNPNLVIATLGTTSSGKSTIVNALIGRKIAPIEAKEMSGGVLKIKHSKEFKLAIAETEEAAWETGIWENLDDLNIYNRVRNGVMIPYNQIRKQRECIAPQVTACVPILPANDPSLLGLPEGIGIEIIDLPGLKSIQDKDNLKIIQEQVAKAFSLVALDYSQVDERHRKRLLEELKQMVEYLQGRTDSMIFILNRVDLRGTDDFPLEQRIEQLKLEIKEVLALEELPDIIPLSGQMLYYAQNAWGAIGITENSPVDSDTRLDFLTAMLEDCSKIIRSHTKEDRTLKRWFRDLEDRVEEREIIDDQSMRKILDLVYEWSGGKKLWECMGDRVNQSFSELVILPALIEVFQNYECFEKEIDVKLNIWKITELQELEEKKEDINRSAEKLKTEVENIRDRFCNELNFIIEACKKDTPEARSKLLQKSFFSKKGVQGLSLFVDSVREVETDLNSQLIIPVRNAFEKDQGTYELEENLTEVITPPKAKAVSKAYDLVERKLSDFEQDNSGDWIKKVPETDLEGCRSLEHAERAVRSLYYAMRQAISSRAEFVLQGQAKKFEGGLQSLLDEYNQELKNLCQQEISSLNLDEIIMANLAQIISQDSLKIPEDIFVFSDDIEQNKTSKREKVGQSKTQETYQEGSCFKEEKTREVTKNVYGNVNYIDLKLPSPKNMARQWSEGITTEKEKLWDILSQWIKENLDYVSEQCNDSINKAIEIAERAFKEQLQAIENDSLKQMEYYQRLEEEKKLVNEIFEQLKQEVI